MKKKENMKNISPDGIHYLISFFGCDKDQLDSMKFWKSILPKSIKNTPMEVLSSYFYKFKPHGITGFLLLSSSHLSIHTWPENNYLACDVFSCAPKDETKKIIDFLLENVIHDEADIKVVKRGYLVC